MMDKDIVVLGAGMVGVCSALALQRKGLKVSLVERREVGGETSFGNAGMITPSSLIPFNNPNIFRQLPKFLSNKSDGFQYSTGYLMSELPALFKFLAAATAQSTNRRINHLHALIERSMHLHKQWQSAEVGAASLRDLGWLKLYRSKASYQSAQYELDIYQQYGIDTKSFDKSQLQQEAAYLNHTYYKGVLIKGALSVASPSALTKAYYDEFIKAGGELLTLDVDSIVQQGDRWLLRSGSQSDVICNQLVVAAGPWSKTLLTKVNVKIPMIFERGAHREFHYDQNTPTQQHLSRPIHDVQAAFVATPIHNGLRVCCGVELNAQNAQYLDNQLNTIEKSARQTLHIPNKKTTQWQGARPTMPDSLPVIGRSRMQGLWLNTGHQHIGFSTGPASGEMLADLMTGQPSHVDTLAFSPKRFNI